MRKYRGVYPLDSPKAAWPKIVRLAKSLKQTGCRFRVKEQGETIILVGAAAALRYAHLDFPRRPDLRLKYHTSDKRASRLGGLARLSSKVQTHKVVGMTSLSQQPSATGYERTFE